MTDSRQKRLRALAWAVVEALQREETQFSDVPEVFAKLQCANWARSTIFEELDRCPALYTSTGGWHSKLRSCRNHPVHGPELFATWGGSQPHLVT